MANQKNNEKIGLSDRVVGANLTEKEAEAVEKIVSDLDKAAFLSGLQMAELCDISATSMTRLVRKLGYSKLTEFKAEIEEMYRKSISPYNMLEDFMQQDAKDAVIQESLWKDYMNIKEMKEMLDENLIRKVSDEIVASRKIYVVGMFASEIVVRAIGNFLWRLGKEYKEIKGIGLLSKLKYSDVEEGDLLIAVSNQRIFKEVFSAVEFGKSEKMKTVAITDKYTNVLARAADYALVAPVKGRVLDSTHVATLTLINILFNLAASNMSDQVKSNLEKEAKKCYNKDFFCV